MEEIPQVPKRDHIDYASNGAIPARCEVAVRLKPLGAGKSDIIYMHDKYGSMRLNYVDADKNIIMFGQEGGKGKQEVFNFPTFIATGEYT